jgi:deoxycytidylate deaminase
MEWHPKFGRIKIFGDERYNPGLHSEIDAILKLNRDNCSNLSFFNIHLDKKLECKNSAPCRNCMAVVNRIGFKTFYFYDENLKKFVGIK